MSFSFPTNPVDGQLISETLPDGTVASATYSALRNEWAVSRRRPASAPVVGADPIEVTPTADRQVITWDAQMKAWVAALPHPPRLAQLADVTHHSAPVLGDVPIWRHPVGQPDAGLFDYGAPNAHLKSWDAFTYWEAGATLFHKGQLWRSTRDGSGVEPVIEPGRVQLYIHMSGEPTFGILPTQVGGTAPPSGTHAAGFKFGYWLQYVDDTHMAVWKFVVKGVDPITHAPTGEWEGRNWPCIAWRGVVPPPTHIPEGVVMVWIYDQRGGTAPPVLGQQDWALLDFSIALGMAVDVDVPSPDDGDILSYDAVTQKWRGVSRASLGLP